MARTLVLTMLISSNTMSSWNSKREHDSAPSYYQELKKDEFEMMPTSAPSRDPPLRSSMAPVWLPPALRPKRPTTARSAVEPLKSALSPKRSPESRPGSKFTHSGVIPDCEQSHRDETQLSQHNEVQQSDDFDAIIVFCLIFVITLITFVILVVVNN